MSPQRRLRRWSAVLFGHHELPTGPPLAVDHFAVADLVLTGPKEWMPKVIAVDAQSGGSSAISTSAI